VPAVEAGLNLGWTSRFGFEIAATVYTETPLGRIQNTSRLDPETERLYQDCYMYNVSAQI